MILERFSNALASTSNCRSPKEKFDPLMIWTLQVVQAYNLRNNITDLLYRNIALEVVEGIFRFLLWTFVTGYQMDPLEYFVYGVIIFKQDTPLTNDWKRLLLGILPSSPDMSKVSRKVPDVNKGSCVIAVRRERKSWREICDIST